MEKELKVIKLNVERQFTCANPECGAIINAQFHSSAKEYTDAADIILTLISQEDDILEIFCPCCGRKNSLKRNIPEFMRNAVDILCTKGYHVLNVFPKILGIQIKELTPEIIQGMDQVDVETFCTNEFIVDLEDTSMRLIKNGRLQDADGFKDYEVPKDEYIVNAINALERFLLKLPEVGPSINFITIGSTMYF